MKLDTSVSPKAKNPQTKWLKSTKLSTRSSLSSAFFLGLLEVVIYVVIITGCTICFAELNVSGCSDLQGDVDESIPGLATNSILSVSFLGYGKHFSLLFLPATPLSASRTLGKLFELTQRPSRAFDSP